MQFINFIQRRALNYKCMKKSVIREYYYIDRKEGKKLSAK